MNRISLIFLACAAAINASAVDIDNTAGTLAGRLPASQAAAETTLRISGTMNAADFAFIDRNMPALTTLDLSDVRITAYSGDAINGIGTYAADVIPAHALAGKQITRLALPANGTLAIGEFAFASTAITEIDIPSNVTSVGTAAFSGCNALTTMVNHGADLGAYSFKGCTALVAADLGGISSVSESAFADCSALQAVSHAEAITEIGARAFASTSSLVNFPFPAGLRAIGDEAFYASALTDVDLRECPSLRTIGAWAFAENNALRSVSLPASVASLGAGAFFDCTALASITLPDNLRQISDYTLKGTSIAAIRLPAATDYIGTHGMHGMTELSAIDARHISAVPALGDDVWEGVNQADVVVSVKKGLEDGYRTADQWQNFDIRGEQTDTYLPQVSTSDYGLRARFSGSTLLIESTISNITLVEIYDPSGMLMLRQPADTDYIAIDTAAIQSPLMIVRCMLADGVDASIKLIRSNG